MKPQSAGDGPMNQRTKYQKVGIGGTMAKMAGVNGLEVRLVKTTLVYELAALKLTGVRQGLGVLCSSCVFWWESV